MKASPLAIELVVLGGLVAATHWVASSLGIYWSVGWADLLVHFLGGLWMGLVALFVFFTAGWLPLPSVSGRVVVAVTLLSVLAVGLAWEVYELFTGLSDVWEDQTDTISDVIADLFGGLAALWYFRVALERRSSSRNG